MSKCTKCNEKESVFKRSYSGENLCAKCFCHSIESRVRETISKYNMFDLSDRIMVAVSGGKDSVALLHLLVKIEKDFPNVTLSAVTVDEGIEGYRDEALRIAKRNCQKLGLEHVVASFREVYGYTLDEIVAIARAKDPEKGLTPCSYCGVIRRRILNTIAREAEIDKLVTAHSLDDETQTILLNIVRGDVVRIARSSPIQTITPLKFVSRAKPFCKVPEKEISFYAYLKKQEFQSIRCPYASTALRSDVRIMLNRFEEKHVGTKFAIFGSIERIRSMLNLTMKKNELRACRLCGEPTTDNLCRPCQMLRELRIF